MRYAQIKAGKKLHLVYEAGELKDNRLQPAGSLSKPLCNTRAFTGYYRLTVNLPMGRACKNCLRVHR
jgi:hypothetical protein